MWLFGRNLVNWRLLLWFNFLLRSQSLTVSWLGDILLLLNNAKVLVAVQAFSAKIIRALALKLAETVIQISIFKFKQVYYVLFFASQI
jgi:hypothetical protein